MRFSFISKSYGNGETAVPRGDRVSIATATPSPSRQVRISAAETTSASSSSRDAGVPSTLDTSYLSPRTSESIFRQPRNESLWARAYVILHDRQPDLLRDYKKHLVTLLKDTNSSTSLPIESIVTRLVADREKAQWRVSLLENNFVIRRQAERLVKFLL
ncbi:hypothetical protein VTN49DRAFT_4057 [Thermomyces lanuginosus]|uniref:uncharacterized protein n=1 Tax=Thermomyces lanuginosus TaxID=5541 RepID=UPI0037432BF8